MKMLSELEFTPEKWGIIIDSVRTEYGIHINDLCKDAGMSASTYTKFEKGAL